jgi:uncharacterized protein YfiM (DUF2279 family)
MSSVAASAVSVVESSGTGEDAEEDQEAMRAAFAAFMMHGKPQEVSSSPPPQSPQSQANSASSAFSKALRKYKPITNAFHGTLVRDWLEVDDNLGQVMASIANLRERCWLTSRLVSKQKQQQQSKNSWSSREGGMNMLRSNPSKNTIRQKPSWKGHGFRVDAEKMTLAEDDLDLALSHDLLQHERMLAGARKLIHSLGEAQEALGRRLDELLLHHMETYRYLDYSMTPDGFVAFEGICSRVDHCQQLYSQSSKELYRKQSLAAQVFDSVADNLLYRERAVSRYGAGDGGDGDDAARSPRAVAQRVVDQWSRTHRESHFYSSAVLLRDV